MDFYLGLRQKNVAGEAYDHTDRNSFSVNFLSFDIRALVLQ
jgi:hypothetical protein